MTSRADALRLVEAIELLLDAGQWEAADDMYTNRAGDDVWRHLPAARLGQRAAGAFVATSARRSDCAAFLDQRRLSVYLTATGLAAMLTGDLAMAQEYLSMAVRDDRDRHDVGDLSVDLRNLADCLAQLGRTGPARDAAAEGLTCAQATDDSTQQHRAHAYLGMVVGLAGDTAEAEQQFLAADQIQVADDPDGDHLYSISGVWWGDWLVRTGRTGPAEVLTARNAYICREQGWNDNLAGCDRLLGRLALAAGDTAAAGEHLEAAAACFRAGDYLTELATTLADMADHAQAAGDLDAAEQHATEAIAIAAPRGLMPAHSAALAARARIRAAQAAAGDRDLLSQGRDAAEAALRLAVHHDLAWHELDALRAHAVLDHAEGIDHGWAAKAGALHARLVPPDLDPDPLTTVELLADEAADEAGPRDGEG